VTQIAVDGGSATQLGQNTILVVDDDADMREALRDVLGDEGYSVILASNGKVALGLLSSLRRPCVIILDVTMPIMGGVELYHAIRAVPDLADIPILFLTSDPLTAPRGVPMVEKSVSLDRLLGTVAELF
jgi:CheY-like chemotaxis protein